jgi:heterotetrameric sarcosine oxidase gamma subunit
MDTVTGNQVSLRSIEPEVLVHIKAHRLPKDCFSPDASPGTEQDGLIWLGPNERLLIGGTAPQLPANVYATDVMDQYVILEVTGTNAERLLQTGTSAYPRTDGSATRLRFGDVTAVVRNLGSDQWQLIVDTSVAHWFSDWLANRIAVLDL